MKLHQAQSKIQRILRDNLYERRALSRSGDIEFLRLAHYKTSRQIFSRKVSESGKHYNFTLLVDMSGSMDWGDAINAIKSCQNIVKLLKWIVNIKISMFNNIHFENIDQDELLSLKNDYDINRYVKDKYMEVPLSYDIDENDRKHIRKAIRWDEWKTWYSFSMAAYGNVETINIEYEYKKLMQLDWRNVLIIIQDWQLSCDHRFNRKWEENIRYLLWKRIKAYDQPEFAKQLYKKISRNVELLSIWIRTTEPEDFFDNFAYVSDAEKVYEVIVKVFERLIS